MAKAIKEQGETPAPLNNEEKKSPAYVVIKQFRDVNDFDKIYTVGTEIKHFSQERLESAMKRGLIEKK